MDILSAHKIFSDFQDRGQTDFFPHSFEIQAPDGNFLDAWPAGAVAAVEMVGHLQGAKNATDLLDGLKDFDEQVFIGNEGFGLEDWCREAGEIADYVIGLTLELEPPPVSQ
jgi:hypothetical protein